MVPVSTNLVDEYPQEECYFCGQIQDAQDNISIRIVDMWLLINGTEVRIVEDVKHFCSPVCLGKFFRDICQE
jgi:hypothetical protein